MLKSMTAFGRADLSTPFGKFTVEVNTLNRKHLDVAIALPKELSSFEVIVRQMITKRINRGKVFVKVSAIFDKMEPLTVVPNLLLAREVKAAWDEIAKNLELDADKGFSLEMLTKVDNILVFNDEFKEKEECLKYLKQAVDAAIDDLLGMRIKEGENLAIDFSTRISNLRALIPDIEKKSQNVVEKYREKLKGLLRQELPESKEIDERVLQEVLILSEKIDITEEICRFNSHLDQFSKLFESKEDVLGKKLEFLILELMREINTIGSKAQDFAISTLVVEIKSELERMRQQIQNIE